MSAEGKMVVLAFIAKQEKLFKAADVFAHTGLDRQLVYYHLNKFVEQGLIEKVDTNYCVLDRNTLIESIAFGNANKKSKEAQPTAIFKNASMLNKIVYNTTCAKAIRAPGAADMKKALNDVIDDTMESLKAAKRNLNSKQIRPSKAEKNFNLRLYLKTGEEFNVELNEEVLKLTYGETEDVRTD